LNDKKTTTTTTAESGDIIETVQKIRKKPGPDPLKYGAENALPGDNARFLRLAMVSWDLPPIDISDPKQVEQRIKDYFYHCAENDRKPNLVGMANWLGIDRTTLNSWKRGEYRSETHSQIIKKAVEVLEEQWVDYMQNGKINPATGIFLGKNFFQYRDTQDVVVTPNNPYETQSPEEIGKKYLQGIVDAEDPGTNE